MPQVSLIARLAAAWRAFRAPSGTTAPNVYRPAASGSSFPFRITFNGQVRQVIADRCVAPGILAARSVDQGTLLMMIVTESHVHGEDIEKFRTALAALDQADCGSV